MQHHIKAIIWDYDGTLADTRHKNLTVTRQIVERITGRPCAEFPALQSIANYEAVTKVAANWREMYQQQYAMTPEQVDRAGWLWAELQWADTTHVPLFEGIADTLAALGHFPHGIVSQNARRTIEDALKRHGVDRHFGCVIGFEEVDIRRQKPAPEGLLQCIRRLTSDDAGLAVYIGDQDTDFQCARNAQHRLRRQGSRLRVVSIGASYGFAAIAQQWAVLPDYHLHAPAALPDLIDTIPNVPHTSRLRPDKQEDRPCD